MIDISRYIKKRGSGILLPVFSLPSKYGIGCLAEEARSFISFLSESGQKYWQILPVGPVNESYSPYQPPSAFAGNPDFIDPRELLGLGLVTQDEFCSFADSVSAHSVRGIFGSIDYKCVLPPRRRLRRAAYERFAALPDSSQYKTEFSRFVNENSFWLNDYALFTVLMKKHGGIPWTEWPEKYKLRDVCALNEIDAAMKHETDFIRFEQYEFFRELIRLHAYARSAGIKIIGDIPIYAAAESADCWSHPEIFQLNDDMKPSALSGCPPDTFSPGGQLWNNPLYRWHDAPTETSAWWAARLRHSLMTADVLRLDHFRGFESYFSIPSDTCDPALGHWEHGPGADFFKNLPDESFPREAFIAEDLGTLTPDVGKLRDELALPGMKVLQFAFDSDSSNTYLPGNFGRYCVIYTGTHDNDTTAGWYRGLDERRAAKVRHFIGSFLLKHREAQFTDLIPADTRRRWVRGLIAEDEIADALVLIAESSKADLCIIPIQDAAGFGTAARTNTPGTASGNWAFELGTAFEFSIYVDRFARITNACRRI